MIGSKYIDLTIIDAHVHFFREKKIISEILHQIGITEVVNIAYGHKNLFDEIDSMNLELRSESDKFDTPVYHFVTTFSLIEMPFQDNCQKIINYLRKQLSQKNVIAVKVWKDLGMLLKDNQGNYIFPNDNRLDPVFRWLNDQRAMVYIHIADPIEAWQLQNTNSPAFLYYKLHPEFLMVGRQNAPTHEALINSFEELIKKWTNISFIACHFASLIHNLKEVGRILNENTNCFIDTSGRLAGLKRLDNNLVREFFTTFSDRVIFGTDWTPQFESYAQVNKDLFVQNSIDRYRKWFNYFEVEIDLPKHILEKIYCVNFRDLLTFNQH